MGLLQSFATFLFALLSFIKDFLDEGEWSSKLFLSLIPVFILFIVFVNDLFWVSGNLTSQNLKYYFYKKMIKDERKLKEKLITLALDGNPVFCNISSITPTFHFGGRCLVIGDLSSIPPNQKSDLNYQPTISDEDFVVGCLTFTFSIGKLTAYNEDKTVMREYEITPEMYLRLKKIINAWRDHPEHGVSDVDGFFTGKLFNGRHVRHSLTIQELLNYSKFDCDIQLVDLADLNYIVGSKCEPTNYLLRKIGEEKLGVVNEEIYNEIIKHYGFEDDQFDFIYQKALKQVSAYIISKSFKYEFKVSKNSSLKKCLVDLDYFFTLIRYGSITYIDKKIKISKFSTQLCRRSEINYSKSLPEKPSFSVLSKRINYKDYKDHATLLQNYSLINDDVIKSEKIFKKENLLLKRNVKCDLVTNYLNFKLEVRIGLANTYKEVLMKLFDPKKELKLNSQNYPVAICYERMIGKEKILKDKKELLDRIIEKKRNKEDFADLRGKIKQKYWVRLNKSADKIVGKQNKSSKKSKNEPKIQPSVPAITSIAHFNKFDILRSNYLNGDWVTNKKFRNIACIDKMKAKHSKFIIKHKDKIDQEDVVFNSVIQKQINFIKSNLEKKELKKKMDEEEELKKKKQRDKERQEEMARRELKVKQDAEYLAAREKCYIHLKSEKVFLKNYKGLFFDRIIDKTETPSLKDHANYGRCLYNIQSALDDKYNITIFVRSHFQDFPNVAAVVSKINKLTKTEFANIKNQAMADYDKIKC